MDYDARETCHCPLHSTVALKLTDKHLEDGQVGCKCDVYFRRGLLYTRESYQDIRWSSAPHTAAKNRPDSPHDPMNVKPTRLYKSTTRLQINNTAPTLLMKQRYPHTRLSTRTFTVQRAQPTPDMIHSLADISYTVNIRSHLSTPSNVIWSVHNSPG